MRTINEITIKVIGLAAIAVSAVYFVLYVRILNTKSLLINKL